jgi:hypothetical protein
MPRALLTLVLTLTLLAPHRLCTCAQAAKAETSPAPAAVDGCPCQHIGDDADHAAAPPGVSPAPPADGAPPARPPCGGHNPGCLAHRANTDRAAGNSARPPAQAAATHDAHPWRPAPLAVIAAAGPSTAPAGDPGRPLYLSLRTLLI